MAQPIISWTDENENILSVWNTDTIYNGDTSNEINIHIWNNKGNTETDIADMKDTKITTSSPENDDITDAVKDHWVSVRLNSTAKNTIADTQFHEIGADQMHQINGEGCEAGIISGAKNTGTNNDKTNYANITMKCTVPNSADSGTRNIVTKVIYFYN